METEPALIKPRISWNTPAKTVANNNDSKPISPTATKIIAINPAAGPDTLTLELLNKPTTIPPIIPVINPAKGDAPDATATPRQSGKATKNTTRPAGKSFLKYLKVKKCLKLLWLFTYVIIYFG